MLGAKPGTHDQMAASSNEQVVRRLLNAAGTTYADEAGIRLKDQPMPLFQLLTLCMLASKPIDATIATQACWRHPRDLCW